MDFTIVAIDGVGEQTLDYVELLVACQQQFPPAARLRLLTSDGEATKQAAGTDVECVAIDPLDYLSYSRFCVEQFVEYVETPYCLTVQLDGFILNSDLWTQDFCEYDYVGAPWLSTRKRPVPHGRHVGNGGFSLRSAKFLQESAKLRWTRDWGDVKVPSAHLGNEDYFLSIIRRPDLESAGVQFAPVELAQRFSIQAGDRWGKEHWLPNVFGFHGGGLLRRVHRYLGGKDVLYPHLERNLPRRRYFILPW